MASLKQLAVTSVLQGACLGPNKTPAGSAQWNKHNTGHFIEVFLPVPGRF